MEEGGTPLSLKEQKVEFVTGHGGSTAWEVLLVCSAAPIGIWLFGSLRHLLDYMDEKNSNNSNTNQQRSSSESTSGSRTNPIQNSNAHHLTKPNLPAPTFSSRIVTEAVVLLLPFVLCQTKWLYPWGTILLWGEAQIALLIYIYFWSVQRLLTLDRNTTNASTNKNKKKNWASAQHYPQQQQQQQQQQEHQPRRQLSTVDEDLEEEDMEALIQEEETLLMKDVMTVYRSSMLYMTFVAILAVDFHVFPRRFAKTEVSGYGLMDLGAASFIIAAGLVSPRARYHRQKRVYHLGKRDATRILPLLALGFIRLATNKGLEYQEHVSEYGVHWNFFFTLAIVTPLGSMIPGRPNWVLPLLLLGGYQYALSNHGWQDFIENGPRSHCDTIIPITNNPLPEQLCTLVLAANREGVLGCFGYLSMYLFGEYIACAFLWTNTVLKRQKIFCVLTAGLWLILYCLEEHLHIPVSRRSTNVSFCVWALAHNMALLAAIRAALYLYHQDLRKLVVTQRTAIKEHKDTRPRVPMVFQAVNRHGFLAFLIANLLTGLVNLSINTLLVSDTVALLIVFVYLCAVSGFSLLLQHILSGPKNDKATKNTNNKPKKE